MRKVDERVRRRPTTIALSPSEKEEFQQYSEEGGFESLSEFIRTAVINYVNTEQGGRREGA